ncbi:MAG: EamA family transporter [Acidimicrobiales bacterium]
MAVLLALCSAASYGVGDFFGGLAAKRAPAAAILLWSHLVGIVLLLGASVFVGGDLTARDFAIGAVGGVAGAAGVGLLYQALSIGPMSAVAPVTALLAAAVPVAAGVARGERPGAAAAVGMLAGVAAIVLVSAEGGGSLRPSDLRGVTFALGAGLGFGLFFVALSYTGDDSGVWPLVGARAVSVTTVGTLALLGRFASTVPAGQPRLLTAGAGALDVAANVLYLFAIREGLLSVVSVLASLYPASTVVLAWLVLRERFAPLQRVGLLLAVPAAILMSV